MRLCRFCRQLGEYDLCSDCAVVRMYGRNCDKCEGVHFVPGEQCILSKEDGSVPRETVEFLRRIRPTALPAASSLPPPARLPAGNPDSQFGWLDVD